MQTLYMLPVTWAILGLDASACHGTSLNGWDIRYLIQSSAGRSDLWFRLGRHRTWEFAPYDPLGPLISIDFMVESYAFSSFRARMRASGGFLKITVPAGVQEKDIQA